jgi:RHS repeat-associated protein
VENRLTQATDSSNGTETYNYDTANQRVWKQGGLTAGMYFYGVDGNLLTSGGWPLNDGNYNVYFAGNLIWAEASQWLPARPVVEDRLGSTVTHFPYGEEASTTGQNRVKFATYYRDSTTALDYARNRYYARTIGRFTSVDPYGGSANAGNPQSLNRYTYVGNDPVNFNDPSGLLMPIPTTPIPVWEVVTVILVMPPYYINGKPVLKIDGLHPKSETRS